MAWTLRFSKLLQVILMDSNSPGALSLSPSLTPCPGRMLCCHLAPKYPFVSEGQSRAGFPVLTLTSIKSFSEVSKTLFKSLYYYYYYYFSGNSYVQPVLRIKG